MFQFYTFPSLVRFLRTLFRLKGLAQNCNDPLEGMSTTLCIISGLTKYLPTKRRRTKKYLILIACEIKNQNQHLPVLSLSLGFQYFALV